MSGSTDGIIIKAKCEKTEDEFDCIYYKAFDGKWVLTYGRKEVPNHPSKGKNNISVDLSSVRTGPQFKCPFCDHKRTTYCPKCNKRTCFDGNSHEGRETVCAYCGTKAVFKRSSGERKPRLFTGEGVIGQA